MAMINPDPNYRDPEFEKKLNFEKGSIDDIDIFNAPPPGHSLTDNPQQWAWERPSIYSTPEDAMDFIVDKIEQPDTEDNFIKLMLAGVPVEAITNTITFTGFSEGYWTPDIAELLKMPVSMHLIGLAIENKIPATVFNTDPEVAKRRLDIPDDQIMHMMSERRPDMYESAMLGINAIENTPLENAVIEGEEVGMPLIEQQPEMSFLDQEEEI
jgi:hypothetical protein